MKVLFYVLVLFGLMSCSSTKMVNSWSNKKYTDYKPQKVLVIGLTDNLTARKIFEQQLKDELLIRGIEAIESHNVFNSSFTSTKQTEEDIDKEIESISKKGIDAVLFSALKGVDEKSTYSGDNYRTGLYSRRFGPYYYLYQDVYFDKGYYNNYKVYHIEASLYNLKENNDKSLVWVSTYNVVDPQTITAAVNDYVKAIIKSLENESLIFKK